MNVGRADFERALNQLADLEKSFSIELANCEKMEDRTICRVIESEIVSKLV